MEKNEDYYGLYLNCKTRKSDSELLYIYEEKEKDITKSNFYFQSNYYIIESLSEKIIDTKKKQSNIEKNKENLLFKLQINKSTNPDEFGAKINLNYLNNLRNINKNNTLPWNTYLWYVVNSDETELKYIKNDDYYLEENDILKIGSVKYIISKLYMKNTNNEIKENKKGKLFDTEPSVIDVSKCEHCGDLLIKLCNCEDFYHFKELKKYVNERYNQENNSKKTVKNYFFNLFYCDEKKNDNKICNTHYSLKFKCKVSDLKEIEYIDSEKIKEDKDIILLNNEEYKIFSLFDFELPKDKDYMILESLEDRFSDTNLKNKSVHIIELNGEDIKIGRNKDSDIILNDKSASWNHAIIKYNKEKRKYFIKNLSKHSGTIVLIHPENKVLEFKFNKDNQKPLFFQVNKTLFEAGVMTLRKFKTFGKNKNSRILLE